MRRPSTLAALSLCVASLFAANVRGQALTDRVPADALFYFGWAGADAVKAAAKETRLEAVLAESRGHELFGRYFDEVAAKIVAQQPRAAEPFRIFRTIAGPAWRSPTAVFVGTPVADEGGELRPRLAILTQAGDDADRVAAEIRALAAKAGDGRENIEVASENGVVIVGVRFDAQARAAAANAALAGDAGFAAAAKRVAPSPATIWYVNVEQTLATVEGEIAESDPDAATKWKAFIDASGLRGVKRFVSASGFDGRDWTTQSFLDAPAPRTGLLASAAGPIDPTLLAAVPADATFFTSARVDVAQGVRDIQAALGKSDPEALKNFNMVLGAAHQVAGTSVLSNLLDPLGPDWVAYASPSVNSSGLLGTVLVNKPENAAKLKRDLTTASRNLVAWINIAIGKAESRDESGIEIHGATTKIGDVEVNYLALPVVAPSWAIHDGRLYLGLYPQSVGAAARSAGRPGPKIADGEKYKAAIARLGVKDPIGTTFYDLPAVAGTGAWYQQWLVLSRYAGLGDLWGVTLPEPLVPPLDVLMANLTPAAGATWADDAGLYRKTITPFPGAMLLSEQGAVSVGGVGGAALGTSVLLPSLNRARETANRVKSASNLKQIGQGMLLHANENRNKYPDDFATLLKTQDLYWEVMISPRTGTALPDEVVGNDEATYKWVAENGDYVYLGKGLRNNSPVETILAYEKPDGLEDGINVLYGDGHVEFQLFARGILEEIEKQKAARGIE